MKTLENNFPKFSISYSKTSILFFANSLNTNNRFFLFKIGLLAVKTYSEMEKSLNLLLIFVVFTLFAYQIPLPTQIDSLIKIRDKDFSDENYELAYKKTIQIIDYYEEKQEWTLAIENLCLGILYSEYIDYNDPTPLIYKGFELVTKYLDNDHVNKAVIYQYYGGVLIEQNKYDSATYYLEIALQTFLETSDQELNIATAQFFLAQAIYFKEEYAQAIQYLLKAEEQAEKLEDSNGILDLVYSLLGAIYYQQHDLESAIYITNKSAQLLNSIEDMYYYDSLSLAGVYQNLGVYYQGINDNKRSKLYLESALEYYQQLNIPQNEIIDVIVNYGILLFHSDLFQEAITQFQNVVTINYKYNQRDTTYFSNRIQIQSNLYLSRCYANLNLLDSAFYFINEALLSAQSLKNTEKIAFLNIRKAKLYYEQKELKTAQRLILKAIPNIKSNVSSKINIDLHHAYNTLGKIAHEQGDYSRALQYFQKALSNNTFGLTNTNDNIQQIEKTYRIDHLVETLENKALTLDSIGTPESLKSAYEHYQVALKWTEKMRQSFAFEASKVNLNENSRRIYKNALATVHQLYETTKEEKYLEEAFVIVEKQKSILLLENMIDEKGTGVLGVPQHLLGREKKLKNKLAHYQQKVIEAGEDATLTALYQGYFDKYQLDFANLKDSLSEAHQDYFNLEYQAAIADISTVQNELLDDNAAFIQFSALDSTWFVFIIEQDFKKVLTLPFGYQEERQLKNLMANLSSNAFSIKGNDALQDFSVASYQVYQSLFEPIIKELSPTTQSLTIAGDGALNFLPFEVLVKSQTNDINSGFIGLPYLIKDYSFHYGYSASLLQQNRNTFETLHSNQNLLAFAPLYEKTAEQPLASRGTLEGLRDNVAVLTGTPKEVKAISTYFDGYFDCSSEATEAGFKNKVEDYGILHLAMHGKADQSSANLAHLIFADDKSDSLNDNKLYHYEITNLATTAQLAVLSACETGVGKNIEGEGVMSLGRSFMYAGVPSVVMSLWKIEDNATSELMPLFYKHLAAGDLKNKALQKAKLEYIENASQLKAHPFYWSSMIALGENQPLKQGHSAWSMSWILGVFGVIMLLFIGFYLFKKRKT